MLQLFEDRVPAPVFHVFRKVVKHCTPVYTSRPQIPLFLRGVISQKQALEILRFEHEGLIDLSFQTPKNLKYEPLGEDETMTDRLPPNLLALFAPRPPLRYLPPADHPPEDRKTPHITGVAAYKHMLNEEFGDYKPTESWLEEKDRKTLEKQEKQHKLLTEGYEEWKNRDDKNVRGDPFKTLFVSRLHYDTETKDLEREFGRYGPIERIRIVLGSGKDDKKNKGKPRGYAFIVFERESDMKGNTPFLLLTFHSECGKYRTLLTPAPPSRLQTDRAPDHQGS